MEVKRAEGGKKKKTRGLSYIAENDTKERYGTCDLQYSNSEKESILQLKYFSSPDPGTEVSETSAAAAVQESGKGRLLDGNKHGNQGGKQSVLNISH